MGGRASAYLFEGHVMTDSIIAKLDAEKATLVRVRERLAKIEKDADKGVYAKHYVEDCTHLIAMLEQERERNRSLSNTLDDYSGFDDD